MNIRLKKLLILLVFAICISIIITGCGKTEEEKRDEEIRSNVWEVVTIIKKDLKKGTLTLVAASTDGNSGNWDKFNCMNTLAKYYNDDNTSKTQRQTIDDMINLAVSYQYYYKDKVLFYEDLIDNIEAIEEDLGEETGLIELIK